jgi:uncharacterized membrane protein YciS (DUF1049 family)
MRQLKNKAAIKLAIVFMFAVLLTLVKFFTVEIRYKDDPTVQLVASYTPSANNKITVVDDKQYSIAFRILVDENGYIGSALYAFICAGGWLLGWVGGGAYWLLLLLKKQAKSKVAAG